MIVRRFLVPILAAFCLIPATRAGGNKSMFRSTTRALSDAKEKTSVKKKISTKESTGKKDGTKHHSTTEEKKSAPPEKHDSTAPTTIKETKKAVDSDNAEQPSGDSKPQDEEKEKTAAASKDDSPEQVDETKTKEANDGSTPIENDEDKESEPEEKDSDGADPKQISASDKDEPHGETEQDDTEKPGDEANESPGESTQDQGQESDDPEKQQKQDDKENQGDSKEETEIRPKDADADSDSMTIDPCQNITACAECEKVNLESISEGKACAWKDSKCQLVDKAEVPSESVCETEAEAASKAKVHDDDDDDEEASFTPAFLTIAVIVGILFAVRKYAENAGVEIPGLSNPTPRNGSGRSLRNHETVPLAGVEDDDWGWEDSAGGDVELAARAHQKEEDDLRMAMALSLSESPTVPPPKQVGNATRRANSGGRISTTSSAGTDDWDDWDDDSAPTSSSRVVSAPVSAPTPAIPAATMSSLGATTSRKTPIIRRPQPPKPKQDDIFASMGLAAKPTFSSPSSSRPSAPAAAATTTTTTSGLATAAEVISADSADWGDDSDLDDLLDD
jgi:hypothetical protein